MDVMKPTKVYEIFTSISKAILDGVLIQQISKTDKEFHFQNWFQTRLSAIGVFFDKGGRNSYPDFALVEFTEGYEIKGLAYPGRESTYDCNSQAPTGSHNGRDIFYVFGRYPPVQDAGEEYPVIDIVICHGDFLNADHQYHHKNKSVKGFGSYGDILIRDRKMYVAPTPYSIASGLTGTRTLIVPADWVAPQNLKSVGELDRIEAETLIVGYTFNFGVNTITPKLVPNPSAGSKHSFTAYRLNQDSSNPVTILKSTSLIHEDEDID
jgi:hypothetical protein